MRRQRAKTVGGDSTEKEVRLASVGKHFHAHFLRISVSLFIAMHKVGN